MHQVLKTLEDISSRYAPSRILSFNSAHILKTLQLIENEGSISRKTLAYELELGDGSIKTLIKHLKMKDMIITTNKGTKMSERGKKIFDEVSRYIRSETRIPRCSISIGHYNHAILLRNLKYAIKNGLEQRDIAIKMGAKGATTLIYENGGFLTTDSKYNALKDEEHVERFLKEKLNPMDNDAIIIGSDDTSYIKAELASKASALHTLQNQRL